MKKFAVAGLALVLALALATVAFASNVYEPKASVSPTKSGTAKKSTPIALKYGFTVTDTQGNRPASLATLKVKYNGIRFNTNNFPGCSAAAIEAAQSAAKCPKRSLVATGYARNLAGAQNNRADKSIRCYLKVSLYNSRNNKGALFVENGQSTDANRDDYCPNLGLATAIPVTITKASSGDTLSFTIPSNLQNPLPTLKNSLVETQLSLRKLTTKVKGKTVGFLETRGGCRKGKRTITSTFTHEDGVTAQSTSAKCKK
jgi:hypothetical protein